MKQRCWTFALAGLAALSLACQSHSKKAPVSNRPAEIDKLLKDLENSVQRDELEIQRRHADDIFKQNRPEVRPSTEAGGQAGTQGIRK